MDITLDDSATDLERFYCPGDVVSGRLTYHVDHEAHNLRNVAMSFEGHGYLTTDPGLKYGTDLDVEHQIYFSKDTRVFQGPYLVKQTLIWPFAFRLPMWVTFAGRPWALPPSLTQLFEGTRKQHTFFLMVRYTIRATAENGHSRSDIQASKHLTVRPTISNLSDVRDALSCVRMTVTSVTKSSKRPVKKKLLDLFRTTPRSAGAFDAAVLVPQRLWIGQKGHISLAVQKTVGGFYAEAPALVLQRVHLRLRNIIHTIDHRRSQRDCGSFLSTSKLPLKLQGRPVTIVANLSMESFTHDPSPLADFYCPTPYFRLTHEIEIELSIMDEATGYMSELSGCLLVHVVGAPSPTRQS
ncbi:hypothetical protein LTR37_019430 [Vermiconidia calcicola]|uniref:Uncharacterized protein n=1 Tax=Vermiconidia calcicola TaxID=1690605 RepID=A0ACC3MFG4_9PEZI|nr:hypothetical protein LTR37_019430 [Vermiconidia calcicola]